MKKLLVLGGPGYARPFWPFFKEIERRPENIAECDAVLFTGGHDVSPELYGDNPNPRTLSNIARDKEEAVIFKVAHDLKMPIFGICRGAQFITVMLGGSLYQHVNGHDKTHMMKAKTPQGTQEIAVTSTHHQMMRPNLKADPVLLGWCNPKLSNVYEGGLVRKLAGPVDEPELVWYPHDNALAAQFHPEFMSENSTGWKYYQQVVRDFLADTLTTYN